MKREKLSIPSMRFLMTVIVSGLLLLLMAVYFIKDDLSNSKGDTVIFIVVGLIAVGAIVIGLLMKYRRDHQLRYLNSVYRVAYDQINAYIATANLSLMEKKKVGYDLLEIFSEAQQRNRDIKDVIGTNQRQFADDVVTALGGKLSWLVYGTIGLQYFIMYMLLIKAADNMDQMSHLKNYLEAEVDQSSLLLFAIVSFIVIPVIFKLNRQHILKQNMFKMIGIFLGIPVLAILTFELMMRILRRYFISYIWVEALVNGTSSVFSTGFGLVILLVVMLGAFPVRRIISRYLINRS